MFEFAAFDRINTRMGRMSKSLSRKGLYEFLEKEYSRIPTGSKVLSVGSGGKINQLLTRFSQQRSFEVVQLDINQYRMPDTVGDAHRLGFGDNCFDFVIMSEVLEHVHSPHLAIQEVYRVLKDKGVLILTTPFILPIHDQPYDYYRYTRYGLAVLLKSYRNVCIQERNSYFEAIDVLWVRLLKTESKMASIFSLFVIPVVFFLKRPITAVLSKLIVTDSMTTGYVVVATK